MSHLNDSRKAALELGSYVAGYVAGVPFVVAMALALCAQVSGSLIGTMLVAPLLVWGTAWLYHLAFVGAKGWILALVRDRPRLTRYGRGRPVHWDARRPAPAVAGTLRPRRR